MGDSSRDDDLSQFSVEHLARRLGTRSAPPKPPPPKRRFVRDLVLIGALIAVALLLIPFADVPNAEYPEARALADRFDAIYASVWRGDTSLEAAAEADGLRVYQFPFDERTISVLTDPQPTAHGTCYGLRTGGGQATVAVKFVPTNGCVPQGRSAFEKVGSWSDVLPSERLTTVWFIPALVVLIGCAMALTTSLVLKLLPQMNQRRTA
jgi:hypothetical protein